ncbi:MAG: YopX family protein [Faecalimonas umbilicata]|uniref:YopX family protein n=1 Tax=Faecalimonas umbilicata TaxID=1912855 RepID=UPI003990EB69
MNREILFKAKRIDNGEWVEGYYVKTRLGTDIKPSDVIFVPFKINRNEEWGWIKIDPETLCQYTGLTDKNGKKIWENDIVKCLKRTEGYELYQVVWRNEFADFGVEPIKPKYGAKYPIGLSDGVTLCGHDYRAFGNIFDNPELLEVE